MSSVDEAVVEESCVFDKVFDARVLPPVPVEGPRDEAIEYTKVHVK